MKNFVTVKVKFHSGVIAGLGGSRKIEASRVSSEIERMTEILKEYSPTFEVI